MKKERCELDLRNIEVSSINDFGVFSEFLKLLTDDSDLSTIGEFTIKGDISHFNWFYTFLKNLDRKMTNYP